MASSSSFELLDERIQHFIWRQGWEALRDVQERAIPPIVAARSDVVVAAETAAGKTEAAFLPALTALLREGGDGLIVYISPLKALINDQLSRLELLCEHLDVPVWPWHGDISSTVKAKFRKTPHGVLLITPEALEATLCNRGTEVRSTFGGTRFFIIDEMHAFIGSERGKQLQSLMHRIEVAIERRVPRVGLSATLGDMRLAADYLRPGAAEQVTLVEASGGSSELKMLVKGYVEPAIDFGSAVGMALDSGEETDEDEPEPLAPGKVAEHLFQVLRGSNNLVFPNRRAEVERYTALLNKLCDAQAMPHEFWPHHGSLSKELRSETEQALKRKDRCATAVCTNTLELGIDIGAVKSVAQVGVPHSVASLRQRLGRSGRRAGESKILRGYLIEDELTSTSRLQDALRLDTVQMAAMLSLLLEGWFEPPVAKGLHLSTLIQQLLSLIAQEGGVTAASAYRELCGAGAPFEGLSSADFIELLRHLGKKELLMQDSGGTLLHGRIGERLVNHYEFYTCFTTDEEYRLVAGGKTLGTLPVSQMLRIGQRLMFGGKTWRVEHIDDGSKSIHVSHTTGGVLPTFASGSGQTHARIRKSMRDVLRGTQPVPFFDATANQLLAEGRKTYRTHGLDDQLVMDQGTSLVLLTWLGDAANEALAAWLTRQGFTSWVIDIGVSVVKGASESQEVFASLAKFSANEALHLEELFADAAALRKEKWDWALPDELLYRSYASLHLDIPAARAWAAELSLAVSEGTCGSTL